ncbi:MAG TPA: hypothetical protein VL463_28810 [Kofleriaceae bacterium]|nr:hypothetical protein [Kofleriaceae bacterium]
MKKNGKKSSDHGKLNHKSETVRALSGEQMTTARGAQYGFSWTCYSDGGCSHTCYYYTSNNDW